MKKEKLMIYILDLKNCVLWVGNFDLKFIEFVAPNLSLIYFCISDIFKTSV